VFTARYALSLYKADNVPSLKGWSAWSSKVVYKQRCHSASKITSCRVERPCLSAYPHSFWPLVFPLHCLENYLGFAVSEWLEFGWSDWVFRCLNRQLYGDIIDVSHVWHWLAKFTAMDWWPSLTVFVYGSVFIILFNPRKTSDHFMCHWFNIHKSYVPLCIYVYRTHKNRQIVNTVYLFICIIYLFVYWTTIHI
jgi:hypothetical protein